MEVDETGHDVSALQVHDLVVLLFDLLRGNDGLDGLAVDDDGLPLHRLHVDAAVEDVPVHISCLFHGSFLPFGDILRRFSIYLLIINRRPAHRNRRPLKKVRTDRVFFAVTWYTENRLFWKIR